MSLTIIQTATSLNNNLRHDGFEANSWRRKWHLLYCRVILLHPSLTTLKLITVLQVQLFRKGTRFHGQEKRIENKGDAS